MACHRELLLIAQREKAAQQRASLLHTFRHPLSPIPRPLFLFLFLTPTYLYSMRESLRMFLGLHWASKVLKVGSGGIEGGEDSDGRVKTDLIVEIFILK